jgi:hypothetical protein
MANPELKRDAPESDWVEYLQGLLVARLQADADAGIVRLSKIDGIFGPITEASVKYFQSQNGLSDDGIVNDATWAALEGAAPSGSASSGSGASGSGNPVTLTSPFKFTLTLPQTSLQQMNQGWSNFSVPSTPGAKLTFQSPVSKLFANGGLQLLHLELGSWSPWYLDWSTKAVLDWSKSNGLELGTENHAEIGLLLLRDVTLSLEGNAKLMWAPIPAQGSVSWDGGLFLKIHFGGVQKKR